METPIKMNDLGVPPFSETPMSHVRISERLQNSQPKVFLKSESLSLGWKHATIQLPTTLLLRLFNQKQETNSVWQCHAMPAKLCLSVQGVSIAPAPKAAPPKAASKHSVEVAKVAWLN